MTNESKKIAFSSGEKALLRANFAALTKWVFSAIRVESALFKDFQVTYSIETALVKI